MSRDKRVLWAPESICNVLSNLSVYCQYQILFASRWFSMLICSTWNNSFLIWMNFNGYFSEDWLVWMKSWFSWKHCYFLFIILASIFLNSYPIPSISFTSTPMICGIVAPWFYTKFFTPQSCSDKFTSIHFASRKNTLRSLQTDWAWISSYHFNNFFLRFSWWKFIKFMGEGDDQENKGRKVEKSHPRARCITNFRHVLCTLFQHLSRLFFLSASWASANEKN